MPPPGPFARLRASATPGGTGEEHSDSEGRPSAARRVGTGVALGLGCALLAAGVTAAMLYALPATQLVHRYAVMAAAFIPYGLFAFAAAAIIFGFSSKRWARLLAVLSVAGLLLQAWWARPYWPATAPADGSVTVLTTNLRCDTRGMSDLAGLIGHLQPDVAVVQGIYLDREELRGEAWGQLLPYGTFHPMSHLPECGTAVFSRTPLRQVRASSRQPVIEVTGATPFLLLPVDMPTPSKGLAPWLEDFQDLTEAVNAHPDAPLVAVGDFNAVREHAPMRALLEETGLRDAAELAGRGWSPTFPSDAWYPPLLVLDHVLVSADAVASDVQTHPISGQSHLAVSVRLGLVA